MELRIAHISDIHFKNVKSHIGINSDDNMREDVVQELINLTTQHGKLDALIVSGDIAYSGKVDEFEIARKWLYSVIERTNSPEAKIIVCPGNHDIDRSVLNDAILDMHDKVRTERDIEKRQALLLSRLEDERSRDLLMSSLENYNRFAVEFGCEFYPDKDRYSWFHDLGMNDGSVLRVRGLNSTILCGKRDAKHSLFLGRNSWSLKREAGVQYLAFAHHPPSWIFDEVEMKNELDDKACIQMYGHEHAARIDPGINSVRLFCGAINPERDHAGWLPGFNFVRLSISTDADDRVLNTIIHSMQWQNTAPSQFVMYRGKHVDGTHRYSTVLPPWTSRTDLAVPTGPAVKIPSCEATNMDKPHSPNVSEQDLVRKFFDLDFAAQKRILDELGLTEKSDLTLPQFMQLKNGLKRAKEQGVMQEIMKKISGEK